MAKCISPSAGHSGSTNVLIVGAGQWWSNGRQDGMGERWSLTTAPSPQVQLAWCVQRLCGKRASQIGLSCARWTGTSPTTGPSSARCG